MSTWTWMDWGGRILGLLDFILWCWILRMHLRERWAEERELRRLARKRALDFAKGRRA